MQFIIVFALGTAIGSFLNVCIFRMPENQSIVFPGSRCRVCAKPIRWFDNIPCVSFFILKGRCRDCGAKISAQYVLVEILTGCLFVIFYGSFGPSLKGVLYLALSLALLVESAIDFRHEIIPDSITLPGTALGLALSAVFPALHGQTDWGHGLLQSLIGVAAGGGFLVIAAVAAEFLLKKEAMGGGDVKLMAMIGSLLGWKGALWTIFVSSVVGSVVGIYLRLRKGQERIPYGPYLGLAAFLYIFFGPAVIGGYLRFLRGY